MNILDLRGRIEDEDHDHLGAIVSEMGQNRREKDGQLFDQYECIPGPFGAVYVKGR